MQLIDGLGWLATTQEGLPPFRLLQPSSLDEAIDLLRSEREAPAIYAGGTDFFAAIREGRPVKSLMSLGKIADLRGLAIANGHLTIGSMTTHDQGSRSDAVKKSIPGLAEAWRRISNIRVRWVATIGGNLMAHRPRYEMAILMSALDANLVFETDQGRRSIPANAICGNYLPRAAILRSVEVPLLRELRFDYERSLRPSLTQALSIWRGVDGHLRGRVAVATEYLLPFCMELELDSRVASRDLAAHAYNLLPADFADVVSSNDYLRQVGAVLLSRQLERLGACNE